MDHGSRLPRIEADAARRGVAQMKDDSILTTGQAAKLLGCCPRTLSKLIDSGKIPGWRLPGGGDRRVKREDVERLKTDGAVKQE